MKSEKWKMEMENGKWKMEMENEDGNQSKKLLSEESSLSQV